MEELVDLWTVTKLSCVPWMADVFWLCLGGSGRGLDFDDGTAMALAGVQLATDSTL